VTFTVQAYPNRTFKGTVQQVRLQSTTQDNVVNYTTVIAVDNPDGKLLPGMTATVQFLTGSATNVLMVPNAALRFRATPDMLAAAGLGQGKRQGAGNSTSANGASATGASTGASAGRSGYTGGLGGGFGGGQRAGGTAGGQSPNGGRPSVGLLWYVDKNGKPAVARVRTGLTDGQNTEIIPRDSTTVTAGLQVIVGTNGTGSTTTTTSSSNPLQPSAPRRGPGGF
jgi:HlyD family secretion protein